MNKLTLARHVMAGLISREDVLQKFKNELDEKCPEDLLKMFLNNIGMNREDFDNFVEMGSRHLKYDTKYYGCKARQQNLFDSTYWFLLTNSSRRPTNLFRL